MAATDIRLNECPGVIAFSPLFIGAMAATIVTADVKITESKLSVPFSSGQWLLPIIIPENSMNDETFSPLFIGAMAATLDENGQSIFAEILSVPFSSGQWLLPQPIQSLKRRFTMTGLSVPFSSGQWLLRL